MAIKAVLFDLGGTLLHYHDPLSTEPRRPFLRITQAAIAAVIEALDAGYPISSVDKARIAAVIDQEIKQTYQAAIRDLRGSSIEEPIRIGLASTGFSIDESGWQFLRRAFYGVIDTIVTPRFGPTDTLSALQDEGYLLGLISNTFWAADLHDRHLAEHDLLDFFPLRFYSCDYPYSKPHPAIFNSALDAMFLAPDEAVYVGDRYDVDVAGSQSAGLYAVLIESPYQIDPPGAVVPDAIISELPELLAVVKALEGR
jgi:putative hydrolase of the HAD superfamily